MALLYSKIYKNKNDKKIKSYDKHNFDKAEPKNLQRLDVDNKSFILLLRVKNVLR